MRCIHPKPADLAPERSRHHGRNGDWRPNVLLRGDVAGHEHHGGLVLGRPHAAGRPVVKRSEHTRMHIRLLVSKRREIRALPDATLPSTRLVFFLVYSNLVCTVRAFATGRKAGRLPSTDTYNGNRGQDMSTHTLIIQTGLVFSCILF